MTQAELEYESITSSVLGRGLICPTSLTRKVKKGVKEESKDKSAIIGSEVHEYLEIVCNEKLSQSSDLQSRLTEFFSKDLQEESRLRIAGIDVKSLPKGRTEVAVKFNPKTEYGAELTLKSRREYNGEEHCIYGTCDVFLSGSTEKELVVIDWKTGQDEWASDSLQLGFFAVAFDAIYRNQYKLITAKIGMVREDGSIEYSEKQFNKSDLNYTRQKLVEIFESVKREREKKDNNKLQSYTPGNHCYYCPNLNQCTIGSGSISKDRYNLMSLGDKWDWLGVQKQWIDQETDRIKALATQEPIPLANGKELSGNYQEKIWFNPRKAFNSLCDLLGEDEARSIGEFKITLTDLQNRFGDKTQEVVARLAELGCIERRNLFVIKARKVRK